MYVLLQEYRGGQLVPMSWTPSQYGNFTNNKTTSSLGSSNPVPWIPMNMDCLTNNVQVKQGSSIKSVSSLISFRKTYFKQEENGLNPIEKRGNYLFHYIHDGELVLERYFSRRKPTSTNSNSQFKKKRKRRSRWNELMNENANYNNHEREWTEGWRRMKRESSNNNITNTNSFPSTSNFHSQELCYNNSSECSLSKRSTSTRRKVNKNGTMERANNDKDNYKILHFSSSFFNTSFTSPSSTEQSTILPSLLSVLQESIVGRKLIGEKNGRTNKNGNENDEKKMNFVVRRMEDEDTSASFSSTTFSTIERTSTTGMVIGPRRSEMIEKEEKRQKVVPQQMMMTKTRIGIEEENGRKEEIAEEAVTALRMSKRNGIKQGADEGREVRKVVAEVGKNASEKLVEGKKESEERFDRRKVIWDRKDGRIEEGDDSSGQKDERINNKNDLNRKRMEELKIEEDESSSHEISGEQEEVRSKVDDGDEVVIGTMVELPRVAASIHEGDELIYDENSHESGRVGIEEELEQEVEEEDERTQGQRIVVEEGQRSSTMIGTSSSRSLNVPSSTILSLGSSISSPFSSSSSNRDEETEVVRSRYVLFANLASSTVRIKDLRDKFHSGSIKVTSNPRRIRDFLYFRSLKLDPGEALIAQVE